MILSFVYICPIVIVFRTTVKQKWCNRKDKCFVLGLVRWFVENFYANFVVFKCVTSNFGSIGVEVEVVSFQLF